jgi:hypothetical protein
MGRSGISDSRRLPQPRRLLRLLQTQPSGYVAAGIYRRLALWCSSRREDRKDDVAGIPKCRLRYLLSIGWDALPAPPRQCLASSAFARLGRHRMPGWSCILGKRDPSAKAAGISLSPRMTRRQQPTQIRVGICDHFLAGLAPSRSERDLSGDKAANRPAAEPSK